MTAEFDTRYALLDDLRRAAALLRTYHEDHWAQWLERDTARIEHGDRYGLEHLLTASGGMGSLNDLIIHRVNGHAVDDHDAVAVNESLHDLRERIWREAGNLLHDLDGK
jgi:Domain of unknown function (DUF6966)